MLQLTRSLSQTPARFLSELRNDGLLFCPGRLKIDPMEGALAEAAVVVVAAGGLVGRRNKLGRPPMLGLLLSVADSFWVLSSLAFPASSTVSSATVSSWSSASSGITTFSVVDGLLVVRRLLKKFGRFRLRKLRGLFLLVAEEF